MDYIIVQAGGKGTRLKHLTKNKPKALVPVNNIPMLFHLFRKYPEKKFVIIADYHKEVLREYLDAFANVKYQVVDAAGQGTCAGIGQALELIPEKQPFMLIWSDLILPETFSLPKEYQNAGEAIDDYIGISETFPCRWSYAEGKFLEEKSLQHGVAGFFLFADKTRLHKIPQEGELVRWMQREGMSFRELSLAGTKEFGLLEEYEKLEREKCRPFNRIHREGNILVKEATDIQGEELACREYAWYDRAQQIQIDGLPIIYGKNPLKMEYISGGNLFECGLNGQEKRDILQELIAMLKKMHQSQHIPSDPFSMREAYYGKTMDRLGKIQDLVPFAREKEIVVNGKRCRNVFYHKRELEERLAKLSGGQFCFIHGDCTFSNIMLRNDRTPVLIDPRGYFGYTELYGDERYDWAKLYYSIVGNYDRFNLKEFRLEILEGEVRLDIDSNHWEDLEGFFFELTNADEYEIKLIHAVIWLSLTTYAWNDYDSICGAFYNGLFYLEDVL